MKHYTVEGNGVKLPYSVAVEANGFVYVSGQLPVDPATGEFVEGGVSEQTQQVFANLKSALALAGLTLDNVVKMTVFLDDMDNFAAMNAVYAAQFGHDFPARSAFAVRGIPRGAMVEIEAIAAK